MGKQKALNKIIIVAMFSALACAGTFIQIRMPAGDFVHLGNFVMIIAALLLGGIEGGLVGSLGMGIYDIIFYSQSPTTIARTFILKFVVGFLVGFLFRLFLKRENKVKFTLYLLSGVFAALFIASLVLFILGDKSDFSISSGLNAKFSGIFGSTKSLSVSLYIPIFSFLFAGGSLAAAIFSHKLDARRGAALVAVLIAIFVNIVGEFVFRFLLEGLFLTNFKTSIVVATSKIPGSVITGFISVILSVLVYEPVYNAVKNVESFNDDTATIEEENNYEKQ